LCVSRKTLGGFGGAFFQQTEGQSLERRKKMENETR